MEKRKDYDRKFKGGCIALLIGANYPADPYALKRVADHTGVSRRSLYRWWELYQGDPDVVELKKPNDKALAEVVTEQKLAIVDMLDYITFGLAKEVKRRIDNDDLTDATLPQLMTAAAISIDKKQLLTGKPTEINEHHLRPTVFLPEIEKLPE